MRSQSGEGAAVMLWAYPIMKKCVMKKNSYAFCRTGRMDKRTRIVSAIIAAKPQGMNHEG